MVFNNFAVGSGQGATGRRAADGRRRAGAAARAGRSLVKRMSATTKYVGYASSICITYGIGLAQRGGFVPLQAALAVAVRGGAERTPGEVAGEGSCGWRTHRSTAEGRPLLLAAAASRAACGGAVRSLGAAVRPWRCRRQVSGLVVAYSCLTPPLRVKAKAE